MVTHIVNQWRNPKRNGVTMAKSHTFRKAKPGESIPATARQLESLMFEHNGRFNSRNYDKFERIELINSSVRDAIHELNYIL